MQSLKFKKYQIIEKYEESEQTYILRVRPKLSKDMHTFSPGQYVYIKNPLSKKSQEEHPFSIASSPTNQQHLEFCIRAVGDWTNEVITLQNGDVLELSEPTGNFVWDSSLSYVVFLLGGTGIAPIMSMLRFMHSTQQHPKIIMLFGNRTPESKAYKKELLELENIINLTVIDIYSHVSNEHSWSGYRGFITKEIIQKEVDFRKKPVFFIIGPPVLTKHIRHELQDFSIPEGNFRTENLALTV